MTQKSVLYLIFPIVVFSLGIMFGKIGTISTEKVNSLQKRLAALERLDVSGSSSAERYPENYQLSADTLKTKQKNMEKKIYARLNQFEQKLRDYSFARHEQEQEQLVDDEEKALSTKDEFKTSIDLLEQAATIGVLDKSTHTKLDEMVKKMDPETNKRFWERMFSDLEAGIYEFPDDDDFNEPTFPDGEVEGEEMGS